MKIVKVMENLKKFFPKFSSYLNYNQYAYKKKDKLILDFERERLKKKILPFQLNRKDQYFLYL